MHTHDISKWQHQHVFDSGNQSAERGTRLVVWITLVMMVVEIIAGWQYNSMALLADGLHMSSHVLALGLSAFAYMAARHYAYDKRFAFGTWKIEVIAGYTSAILLACIAIIMVISSAERLLSPQPIQYQEAAFVACIGLAVNLLCAYILGSTHHHHEHGHGHKHQHDHHHDLNLKSAYLHVIADAATSLLAIVALAGGWFYGWSWLDLDREMDHEVVDEIREVIASEFSKSDTILADLHVWRVGKAAYSVALSVVTHDQNLTPEHVRTALQIHEELVHVTVEINHCT